MSADGPTVPSEAAAGPLVRVDVRLGAVEEWEIVTLRTRFEDFTGLFVLRCHIFNHEDLGMMQLVEVHAP
jgi:FtsP/CotA-like multicopper oxidase with cupredoxin domain